MEAGTILLGKYRVDEVLGVGGMGRVVKASHLYLQQPVAIKILLPQMAASAETVSRFLREAQATVRLKSEHIARVSDVGTLADGVPFMVMEYLDGNDLNQILRHHGPQLPPIVCDLMLQACEGMAEAHANAIVHRDIKPSNFFITRRADGSMLLKILDFGISKTPAGITELTGTQTVLGTPTYMAPEQMKSGRNADQRSDIWSMGVVMYQLLSGRPPFSGESYPELVLKVGGEPPAPMHVQLPAGLGEVILRCLEKTPAMRQQNVAELARTLAPFASDPAQAAQSAARTQRILQQKSGSPQQGSPLSAGGGRLTPAPISPAQLTPRSWPPSTTSQGHGQVTQRTRSSKGLLIAAVVFLCVAAGAGGYIASEMRQDDHAHVSAPPTEEPKAAAEPTTKAEPPPPTAPTAKSDPTAKSEPTAKPEPTATATSEPTAKPEPTAPPKSESTTPPTSSATPAKPTPAVVRKPVAKPAATPVAKPVAKPAAKPAAKKPKRDEDLFDSRH
ncbi:MAG: protein kinase [Kofleriaceae bacterium]